MDTRHSECPVLARSPWGAGGAHRPDCPDGRLLLRARSGGYLEQRIPDGTGRHCRKRVNGARYLSLCRRGLGNDRERRWRAAEGHDGSAPIVEVRAHNRHEVAPGAWQGIKVDLDGLDRSGQWRARHDKWAGA